MESIKLIDGLEKESSIKLTLFQKIIAVTNGSITQLLEIFSGQEIVVETLSQIIRQASPDEAKHLDVKAGESINDREVLIKGVRDSRVFSYARSIMPVELLPQGLSESLMSEDTPLGKLLIKYRIEGRRELRDVKLVVDSGYEALFGFKDRFLVKRYVFISEGKIIMHISEVYPLSVIQ